MPWFVLYDSPKYAAIKEPITYSKYAQTFIITVFVLIITISRNKVPLNETGIFGILELLASFGLNSGQIAILVYCATSRLFLPYYEWMSFGLTFTMFVIGKIIQSQTNAKMESEFHKNETLSNYTNLSLYYEEMQGYNSSQEFQNQTDVATKSQNTINDDLVNLPVINVGMHVLFALLFSYIYCNSSPSTPDDTEQGTSQVLYTSSSCAPSNLSGPSVNSNLDIIFSQDHRVQVAVLPIRYQTLEELGNQDAQTSEPFLQPAYVDISSSERAEVDSLPGQSRNDAAQIISPDDQSAEVSRL